jgi:hypothetical protein
MSTASSNVPLIPSNITQNNPPAPHILTLQNVASVTPPLVISHYQASTPATEQPLRRYTRSSRTIARSTTTYYDQPRYPLKQPRVATSLLSRASPPTVNNTQRTRTNSLKLATTTSTLRSSAPDSPHNGNPHQRRANNGSHTGLELSIVAGDLIVLTATEWRERTIYWTLFP